MSTRYDPRAQIKAIAEDLRRHRDTIEKMAGAGLYGDDAKLRTAAIGVGEAAALLLEVVHAGAGRTETFLR